MSSDLDDLAEQIVVLSTLTGMSIVNAAYAVLPDLDMKDIQQTMEWTERINRAKIKLAKLGNQAHSQHITPEDPC